MSYINEKEAVRRLGVFLKGQLDEARRMGALDEIRAIFVLITDVAILEALVERGTPLEEPQQPEPGAETLFRVIRHMVGDETLQVLLEPYKPGSQVELHEGDEFITGTLNSDPWAPPPGATP